MRTVVRKTGHIDTYKGGRLKRSILGKMGRQEGVVLERVQEPRDNVVEECWLSCTGVIPHSLQEPLDQMS